MPPPARRRALPSSCHRRPRGLVLQGGARHWTEAATWCRAARPRSCPGFWVQACRTAHRMTTALRRAARRGRRFSVNDPCFCIIGGMIAIRNLSMRLVSGGREVSILDDISLDVPAKQFLAIVGPSGSGKSTLLGLIDRKRSELQSRLHLVCRLLLEKKNDISNHEEGRELPDDVSFTAAPVLSNL